MSSQLILQPDGAAGVDTYFTSAGYADINLGDATVLGVGTTYAAKVSTFSRAALQFDLRSLPAGAVLIDATLTLFTNGGSSFSPGSTFAAYRLTRTDWTEFGATWNQYDGSHAWTTAGGDYSSTDHDQTALSSGDLALAGLKNLAVDAIANRGGFLNLLIIGPESAGATNFFSCHSSDGSDPSKRPQLVVNYDLPRLLTPNFTGGMQELTGNLGA